MLQEKTDMGKVNVASAQSGYSKKDGCGAVVLARRSFVLWAVVALVLVGLAFGYGYFFGRWEQIALNKSVLKAIPDVNCSGASAVQKI